MYFLGNFGNFEPFLYRYWVEKMIDTIDFNTSDFDIDLSKNAQSSYPLLVSKMKQLPLEQREEPFLLVDKNGVVVHGVSLATVKPIRDTGIFEIKNYPGKDGAPQARLHFRCSVPHFTSGDNFYTSTKGDMRLFEKEVEKEFSEMGIYCNVQEAALSRLDCTKNADMLYTPSTYMPVIKHASIKSEKGIAFSKETGTQTLTVSSTKHNQLCVYDKILCMQNLGHDIPKQIQGHNILRVEQRYTDKKTIFAKTGMQCLHDIYKEYDNLEPVYKTELEKLVFHNQEQKQNVQCIDIGQIAIECYQKSMQARAQNKKVHWVNLLWNTLLFKGAQNAVEQLVQYGIENLLNQVQEIRLLNNQKYETVKNMKTYDKKKFEKFIAQFNQYRATDLEQVSFMDLYQELQEKLLA